MIDDRVFIQNIRNIMRIKNLSISDLSKIVGHNMHPILNEKSKISMNCVRDCADKLKMNIWELFFPNPEQFPELLQGKDNHNLEFQLELYKKENHELQEQLDKYIRTQGTDPLNDRVILFKAVPSGFVIQKNGVNIPVSISNIDINQQEQIYVDAGLIVDDVVIQGGIK